MMGLEVQDELPSSVWTNMAEYQTGSNETDEFKNSDHIIRIRASIITDLFKGDMH